MTGDLRAALEMLRPHLQPGARPEDTARAFHAAAIVWCRAIEADEQRRQRFEARVAEKIESFENRLQERSERNLRIRMMRLALAEVQEVLTDTRVRAGLPARVFEVNVAKARGEHPGREAAT